MSWASFVPDVLATFIGAVLGIGGAFAIERHRKDGERDAEAERFRVRAMAVADSIKRNADNGLSQWADLDVTRAVSSDTLELAIWEIHREELARLADDVSLLTDVARWFDSVKALAELHSQHRRHLIGVESLDFPAPMLVLAHLQQGCKDLAAIAPDLVDALRGTQPK